MKTNIYPPPIYRLDKINNYIKVKLDNYLRDSKEMSKGAFEKTIFMRMFFENEIEQSKILLSEVGQNNRDQNLNPYSMSLARSVYGYAKDYELIHLEKEFFKFYIISLEKHLGVLLNSLNKIQPEAIKPDEVIQTKKEFKDFFNPDVDIEIIDKIQKEFKEYNGKKMAYLIYLLHKEFKLINYSVNSRDMSRKHFAGSLVGEPIKMQGINVLFETNDVKFKNSKFEEDPYYIETKEKLSKTIA